LHLQLGLAEKEMIRNSRSEKKVKKAFTVVVPFHKKYTFVPKECILVPQRYILVPKLYISVPKWYIRLPFERVLS